MRTEKDYAIEHGGYLTDAAEQYLKVVAESYRETDEADSDLISDCYSALKSAIYEFRKRSERAAEPKAETAPQAKLMMQHPSGDVHEYCPDSIHPSMSKMQDSA